MAEPEDFDFKSPPFQQADIEKIKSIMSYHFKIYDIRWSEKTAAFYFNFNDIDFEEKFEGLRIRLKEEQFIPRVTREGGEYIIYIIRSPKLKKRRIWINVLLIIITIFTTTWAGSLLWFSRINAAGNSYNIIDPLLSAESVVFGFLSFALPLMIILGTHETAHYMTAKRYNIDASLPYFIPLPPPFILGTFGAFISMREPISNKKALLDIGAAGPIAGFFVSLPILIIGLFLESTYPVTISELPSQVIVFNEPLLFYGLRSLFPTPENGLMHPTVFAGWVGLFVTALNLLPSGQLDGGHIARALLGDKAKYLSFMVVVILFILSFLTGFPAWIFFAFFILFMGTSHPPPLNDISKLGAKRHAIGAFCMVMLIICIHYAPISELTLPEYKLDFECENNSQVVDFNGTAFYLIEVTNTAEIDGNVDFTYEMRSNNTDITEWSSEIQLKTSKNENIIDWNEFELKKGDHFKILVNVTPNQTLNYGDTINHTLKVNISGMRKHSKTYELNTHVGTFDLNIHDLDEPLYVGNTRNLNISVKNILNQINTINLTYDLNLPPGESIDDWLVTLNRPYLQLEPQESTLIYLNVTPPDDARPGTSVVLLLNGKSELNPQAFDSIEFYLEVAKGVEIQKTINNI